MTPARVRLHDMTNPYYMDRACFLVPAPNVRKKRILNLISSFNLACSSLLCSGGSFHTPLLDLYFSELSLWYHYCCLYLQEVPAELQQWKHFNRTCRILLAYVFMDLWRFYHWSTIHITQGFLMDSLLFNDGLRTNYHFSLQVKSHIDTNLYFQ